MADADRIVEEFRQTREQLREQPRTRQRADEPPYFYDPDTGELKPEEEPRPREAPRRAEPPSRPQAIRMPDKTVD